LVFFLFSKIRASKQCSCKLRSETSYRYQQQRDLSNQPMHQPIHDASERFCCAGRLQYPKKHPKLSQPHERITSVTSGRRSLLENMGDAQTVHSDSNRISYFVCRGRLIHACAFESRLNLVGGTYYFPTSRS
jgi:hypothetical protein